MTWMLAQAADGSFEVVLTPELVALVPAVAMVIQILKGIPAMEKFKPWLPLAAIGISVGLAFLLGVGEALQDTILAGVTLGMAVVGGYETAKHTGRKQVDATVVS